MTRRKSFSTYAPTSEPIQIELNDRTFVCLPTLPGAVLLDFTASVAADNPAQMASAISTLIEVSVVPEQRDEWNAYVRDPANNVSIETLAEIAGYLAEEYVSRPTQPSSPSSDGPVPVGPLRTVPPS